MYDGFRNNNKVVLNDTLESIEQIRTINLDDSQQAYEKNSLVHFPSNGD